ncbi:hypothetical protein [Cohnella candidum]|uniref:Glycosyltransferase RgtA/B/C/D-like domain-containing protein n=1 Tax=Cohnella candidum TaxID=2674991 RepID=A0A3G3JVE5_9BACL|nr:hypothetical protein [Cohnella candidum]AYQ72218.1 hypothetical protein EAV92_06320 [Cohnella candidum]
MIPKMLPAALGAMTVLALLLLFPRYTYNDPDTFWHIELGRYMVEHQTVLHHAIHTFYGDKLPYVPHEFAFQIVISLLYTAFGWAGAYLLTAFCLAMLIFGMDRLTRVSRTELGLEPRHPLLLPFILLVVSWIFYNYFAIRPQMVSAWMIVWFVAFLREFQMRPSGKKTVLLTLLSLGVANFHAGVWLVIAAFTAMAVIETWWERRWTKRHTFTFAAVLLAGLANPGGLKSILFILTVTKGDFNMLINEWQPIPFAKMAHFPILLLLLFFVSILPFTLHRKPFRFLFMLGILYLGVSSFKQNLFMWLFIPYFAATLPDEIPALRGMRVKFGTRSLAVCLLIGLAANTWQVFQQPPAVDVRLYPVKEMDFILRQTADGHRPKVMASYGASGYVMFRGGDVLCDGRQDPFVTDESKGALGWNAFQRSMYGFGEYLPEIVAYDKPEYVIARNDVSGKLLEDWSKEFGPPAFKGDFGSVFAIAR